MTEEKPVFWKWQYILPVLLFVGTLIWGLYVLYVQKERKRLDFSIVSEAVVADLNTRPHKDLKLFFNNNEINDASLVSVKVKNSGNVHLYPIDSKDLANVKNSKISITFGKNVTILSAHLVKLGSDKSSSLIKQKTTQHNQIHYVIELLNSNAQVRIDIIVANYKPDTHASFAASGLGLKSRMVPADRLLKLRWWQIVLVVIFSAIILIIFRPWIDKFIKLIVYNIPFIGISSVYLMNALVLRSTLNPKDRDNQVYATSCILYFICFLAILIGLRYLIDYCLLTIL